MNKMIAGFIIGGFAFTSFTIFNWLTCGAQASSTDQVIGSFLGAFFTITFTILYEKFNRVVDQKEQTLNCLVFIEQYLVRLHTDILNTRNQLNEFLVLLNASQLSTPIQFELPIRRDLIEKLKDPILANNLDEITSNCEFINRTSERSCSQYNELKSIITIETQTVENYDKTKNLRLFSQKMLPSFEGLSSTSLDLFRTVEYNIALVRSSIIIYKTKSLLNRFIFSDHNKGGIIDIDKHKITIQDQIKSLYKQ